MQKRNSLLFLLTLIGLIPFAFFLSFQDLGNVVEGIIGVVWFLVTILLGLGFWKLRRTSQEQWTILVLGGFSLIFAFFISRTYYRCSSQTGASASSHLCKHSGDTRSPLHLHGRDDHSYIDTLCPGEFSLNQRSQTALLTSLPGNSVSYMWRSAFTPFQTKIVEVRKCNCSVECSQPERR